MVSGRNDDDDDDDVEGVEEGRTSGRATTGLMPLMLTSVAARVGSRRRAETAKAALENSCVCLITCSLSSSRFFLISSVLDWLRNNDKEAN